MANPLEEVLVEENEEERIPNVIDPCWREMSAPILEFFAKPKNWAEIRQWAAGKFKAEMLGHCVAWLEENGLARSFIRDGKVHWVVTTLRFTEEMDADQSSIDATAEECQSENV